MVATSDQKLPDPVGHGELNAAGEVNLQTMKNVSSGLLGLAVAPLTAAWRAGAGCFYPDSLVIRKPESERLHCGDSKRLGVRC